MRVRFVIVTVMLGLSLTSSLVACDMREKTRESVAKDLDTTLPKGCGAVNSNITRLAVTCEGAAATDGDATAQAVGQCIRRMCTKMKAVAVDGVDVRIGMHTYATSADSIRDGECNLIKSD